MSLISPQIATFQQSSSWIRRMFEAGAELKQSYGAENVYDFSLGNPDLPPPAAIVEAICDLAGQVSCEGGLSYMSNAGYPETRAALAAWLSQDQGITINAENLILTVGAAGGLNCFFHTVLSPGDEVICPAPYFVEYGFYCGNHGGVLRPVKSKPDSFELDLGAIAAAIGSKTRCLLINSPNNPSGVGYSADELKALAELLTEASSKYGRPVYLVSDEPYRFLNFSGRPLPSVFAHYKHSVIVSSFSKNLALAGERIGYVAANPAIRNAGELMAGLVFSNRVLGYVNAPCLGQKIINACIAKADELTAPLFEVYAERRRLMAEVLDVAGIQYQLPAGTFYFFPKAPEGMDDIAFVQRLLEQRILAVPGAGFGYPGYFRLSLCLDKKFIQAAKDGFIKAMQGE